MQQSIVRAMEFDPRCERVALEHIEPGGLPGFSAYCGGQHRVMEPRPRYFELAVLLPQGVAHSFGLAASGAGSFEKMRHLQAAIRRADRAFRSPVRRA